MTRRTVPPDIAFLLCRTSVTCHRPTIFPPRLKRSTIPSGKPFRKSRMNPFGCLSMESFLVILFHQHRQAMFPTISDITTARLPCLSFTVNLSSDRTRYLFISFFNCCFLSLSLSLCWRRRIILNRPLLMSRRSSCQWDLIDCRCSKCDMPKSFDLCRRWRQSPEDTQSFSFDEENSSRLAARSNASMAFLRVNHCRLQLTFNGGITMKLILHFVVRSNRRHFRFTICG